MQVINSALLGLVFLQLIGIIYTIEQASDKKLKNYVKKNRRGNSYTSSSVANATGGFGGWKIIQSIFPACSSARMRNRMY